jgi:hypothetical protein
VRLLAETCGRVDHDVGLITLSLSTEYRLKQATFCGDPCENETTAPGSAHRLTEAVIFECVELAATLNHRMVAEYSEKLRVKRTCRLVSRAVRDHEPTFVQNSRLREPDDGVQVVCERARLDYAGEADGVVDKDDCAVLGR